MSPISLREMIGKRRSVVVIRLLISRWLAARWQRLSAVEAREVVDQQALDRVIIAGPMIH